MTMRKLSGGNQIKWGAALSYAAIAINIVATLLYTPWMKNQIGVSNYGLYTLAISFISLFMMDFGIGAATARFVAKYRAEGDTDAVNRLLGMVYKLYLLIDGAVAVVLLVLFFFLETVYAGLTPAELSQFKELYLIVTAFNLFSFPFTTLNGVLNAYEKFVPLKLCDVFHKLSSVLFVVCVLLGGLGLRALVLANSLSGVITILIKLSIVKKTTPAKVDWRARDMMLLRQIAGFSVWMCVASIAQRLMYNITPSILGAVSNSYHVALFSPAWSIAQYFYTIAAAINGLFLPTISRKIAEDKEDEILPLMIRMGRFQMAILGLLYVGFWVVGKEFMCLWMGEEFAPAYYCALLLTLPNVIEYSQQIANTTMIAKNKVKYTALAWLTGSLVNVALSVFLSARFGVVGAGVALLIGSLVFIALTNVFYHRMLPIDMFRFYKACYLPMLIPMVGGIAASTALTRLVPLGGWTGLAVKGVITAAVFAVLVFIFHMEKEEKRKILSVFHRSK